MMNDKLLHDILTKVINLNKYKNRKFSFDYMHGSITVSEYLGKEAAVFYATGIYNPTDEQLQEISNKLSELLEEQ